MGNSLPEILNIKQAARECRNNTVMHASAVGIAAVPYHSPCRYKVYLQSRLTAAMQYCGNAVMQAQHVAS